MYFIWHILDDESLFKSFLKMWKSPISNDTKITVIQWFKTCGYFWILVPYEIERKNLPNINKMRPSRIDWWLNYQFVRQTKWRCYFVVKRGFSQPEISLLLLFKCSNFLKIQFVSPFWVLRYYKNFLFWQKRTRFYNLLLKGSWIAKDD